MKTAYITWCSTMLMLVVAGCGSATPAAETSQAPAQTTPPPSPGPAVQEPQDNDNKDTAEAKNEAADEPEREARRPMAIFNDPTEPATIGLDGAVFRLEEGAELRIPAGAISTPRNVFFTVKPKVKGTKGKVGNVFEIELRIPGAEVNLAQAQASSPVSSSADPFIVKLPLPDGSDNASLAVETVSLDAKGKAKSRWTVVPQTKLETADTGNRAVFELSELPDGHIHLTN